MNVRQKLRLRFAGVILLGIAAGVIAYPRALFFLPESFRAPVERLQLNLGLDLQGGIHLEYKADVSGLPEEKRADALSAAEAVIERRVNAFGVGEPLVQLSKSGGEDRIIVELPGVSDIEEAKRMLKETPFLEFRKEAPPEAAKVFEEKNEAIKRLAGNILERAKQGEDFATLAKQYSEDPGSKDQGGDLDFATRGTYVTTFDDVAFKDDFKKDQVWPELVETSFGWHILKKLDERGEGENRETRIAHILFLQDSIENHPDQMFVETGLTGQNLKDAYVDYQSQGVANPQVALRFDDQGARLFADITRENVGRRIAILIDGEIVSAPVVQVEILNGQAVITGDFTLDEAKQMVARLNEGALPVPITLVGQQSISASLGQVSLEQSLRAGLVGLLVVAVFMILYYRFLGLVAVIALLIYTALLVATFKLSVFTPFSITLTLAGIAGFILSIGMAVDANILISERTWEEIRHGKSVPKAIEEGFRRAWPSIRDSNSSTILTCLILMWLGTGFVKGFAFVLLLGVVFSMFTAVMLTRTMLRTLGGDWLSRRLSLIAPRSKHPASETTSVA